jgi:RHS repeat-associated protein
VLYVGGNTTCSVGLPSAASGQVTFSLDGQPNTTASPNTLGLVEALVNLASASTTTHTITFNYPGDGTNPASSGNTTVTIEPTGSTLPNESIVYQFSITKPDGSSGFSPNGNVLGYMDSVNGSWSQINYDGLNRLISAQVTPALNGTQTSNLCWSYDSFGNRTSQIQSNQPIAGDGTYCSPQSPATSSGAYTVYTPSNQIDHNVDVATGNSNHPVQYDPSGGGNVIADGQLGSTPHNYLYDAEGRVCVVQLPPVIAGEPNFVRYLYDAEGNRIGKGTTALWSCDSDNDSTFILTNEYVIGLNGEQVTEFDGNGNRLHTNAYAGAQLIATYDFTASSEAVLHYHLTDWLGTQRIQVTPAGATEEAWQSLPFGEFVPSNDQVALGATEHHFTGKERDTESGNDYFGARYYSSTMGRFMSPDWNDTPNPVPYADLRYPQTLNLYGYVGNNPLSRTDDDGHDGAIPTATCGGGIGGLLCKLGQYLRGGQNDPSLPHSNEDFQILARSQALQQQAWQRQHPTLALINRGLSGAPPDPNDPNSFTRVGMVPWGMTGGLGVGALKNLGLLANEEKAVAGVLKQIAQGLTKGKEFENYASLASGGVKPLATQAAGYYREFTVPLAGQFGRGAARIVAGAGGEVYLTLDHYVTWIKIQ